MSHGEGSAMCMLEQILIFVEVFKEFRTASVIAAIWDTRSVDDPCSSGRATGPSRGTVDRSSDAVPTTDSFIYSRVQYLSLSLEISRAGVCVCVCVCGAV